MADAEIRFRATLDDDASRGIDQLDSKVQQSGSKAARANADIGKSAAQAARDTGTAAAKIGQAYSAVEVRAKTAGRNIASAMAGTKVEQTFSKWKRGMQDFTSGFKDAQAAASSFTGKMAEHGARTRKAIDSAYAPLKNFRAGFKDAGDAAAAFSGKMGSLGGAARKASDAVGGVFNSAKNLASAAAAKGREIGDQYMGGVKQRIEAGKTALADAWNGIGKAVAVGVGVAVGASVVTAVKNAAEMEQTMGAMDAVFKENAGQMIQWSLTAAETVGLSKVEYQSLATVLGSSLKNGGMALDEVGGKTNELIGVGADLSSMFGGTTKDAIEALTAALRGESDPIERYGVSLTAAKVEAEALAMGATKVNGELTTQAKQAAILSLVTQQTADAQGNFARETGTFSGALQIFRAQWANMTTQWASNVIPMLSTLVVWFSNRIIPALDNASNGIGAFFHFVRNGAGGDWGMLEGFDLKMQNIGIAVHNAGVKVAEMWGKAQPLFSWIGANKDVFGTLALGIGIAATAMGTLTAVTWLLNAALAIAFSPVVLIGVFIGAVILAYNKIGWFKDAVNSAWETIKVGASAVGTAIAFVWNFVATSASIIWATVSSTVLGVLNGIRTGWSALTGFFSALWTGIVTLTTTYVASLVSGWNSFVVGTRLAWEAVRAAVSVVTTWFAVTARAAWDAAVRGVGAVMTWLRDTIVRPVWDGIRIAVAVVIGVLTTILQAFTFVIRNTLAPAFTWLNTAVIQPAWTAIRTTISMAWNFIRDTVFNPLIAFIRGALNSAWTFIRTAIATVWTAIRTASSQAWIFLRDSVFMPVINFIRGAFTAAWNYIRDTITARWQLIRTVSSQAWAFLRDSVFNPVINFIRGAFTAAWNFIRDTITARWQAIRTLSSQAWVFLRDSVFTPIINFLRVNVTNAWNYVRDMITNAWNAVRDRVRNGYNEMKSGALDPLVRFVRDTIPQAFASARDAIGRAWDGIKKKVIDPVNEVVRVIKNVLIGNINNALKAFNLPTINVGFNAPSGGGFRDGGYTGPGYAGAPAGVVHRDEHVIKSPSRRSVEDRFPGFLDDLNSRGAAAIASRFNNPAQMAIGASVYGGKGSFGNPLQHNVFSSGVLKVSGSAPGYDLPGAIRMLDNATKVKVQAGSGGNNTVSVNAGNYPDWWGGYYSGNSIMLNNRIAATMSAASKRTMLAHEIGHALGLPHSDPGPQSVMSYANMYNHQSVTAADVAALSAIYGGTGFASGGGGGIDILGVITKGAKSVFDGLFKSDNVGARLAGGAGSFLMKKAVDWVTGRSEAARGIVLPGYSPGNDSIPLMVSPGESVLTPQLTRALGGANITAANNAATGNRAGGSDGAVGLLTRGLGTANGTTINVDLNITIEGNATTDVLDRLEGELEDRITAIIERATRRGY